jgi:acetyltransferase
LKENGKHRADLQKLFVLTTHRGQGIAQALLLAAENAALTRGLHLLVLDTEKASVAENLYQASGWQRAGEIPNFALTPSGKLHATVVYFKELSVTGDQHV